MKKISLLLMTCITFCTFNLAFAQQEIEVTPPTATREVHSMWKNNDLVVFGYYKPYTTVKIMDKETVLGEGMTDALGKFEVTIKGIDPSVSHFIFLKGFDRFQREIKDVVASNTNNIQVQNEISLTVAPGVLYQGQLSDEGGNVMTDAVIQVYDKEGVLLTRTQTDNQGNFAFTGVPKDGYMVVEKEGYGLMKKEITGEQMNITVSKSGNYTPPVKAETNDNQIQVEQEEKVDSTFMTVGIVAMMVVVLMVIVFIVVKLKRQEKI